MSGRAETNPLTGWLYEAEYRGRGEDDYAFCGHVNVGGVSYQLRVYGPESVRGTTRQRYRLKLTPSKPSA